MGVTSPTTSSHDLAALFRAARPLDGPPALAAHLERQLGLGSVLAAALGGANVSPPTLGQYLGLTRVGAGGMGVVYRATRPDGLPVAIKVLTSDAAPHRLRFAREVAILQAIEHPRVVRYVESGQTEAGAPYLVMDWLEGCDLAHHLRSGPLSVDEALRVALHAAEGLAAAHEAGVVHRDVKPGNLFLCGGRLDGVRIIDFGIALGDGIGADARLTTTGTAIGSPAYMAPEQVRGQTDPRTDIYALGATLFECLIGRPPFHGDSAAAVLLGVLAEAPPSLVALRPDVPAQVDVLVGRMLSKQPSARPPTMQAVIAELSGLMAERRSTAGSRPVLSRSERLRATATRSTHEPDGLGELVGRGRELGLLMGELEGALEDEAATVVILTGPPSIGRSALLLDLVERARGDGRWSVIVLRSRPEEAGVPFATLDRLLAQLPSNVRSTPPAKAFEELRTGTSTALAPHRDPLAQADQLLLAFHGVVDVLAAEGAYAVFIEDFEAVDLSSRRYLEFAARLLGERPFALVVIAATPAEVVSSPDSRRVVLQVPPLSLALTRRLAARWAPEASAEVLAHIARLSGGNPGYLRELCRTAASGRPIAVENFAELVWAKLSSIDEAARRLLRAGAIVGDGFTSAAVAELLGLEDADPSLAAAVRALESAGFIAASTHSTGGRFHFASDLVYLAAYGLCTEADLRGGHAIAGRHLEASGQRGAHVGRHFMAAGEPERAQPHFIHGLRAALAGGDEGSAERCLAAARECGPDGPEQAILAAQFAFWRGDPRGAFEAAIGASPRPALDSETGLRLASFVITSAGQLGRNDAMKEQALAIVALLSRPAQSAAIRDAQLVALGRAATQLDALGDESANALREAITTALAAASESVGAEARAWVARARGSGASRHVDESIRHLEAAHLAHGEAGDPRSAAQVGLYLGSYYCWSGAFELADTVIRDAIGVARRLNASYLVIWGRYVLGKVQVEVEPEDALEALEAVSVEAEQSPRIAQGALIYAALAALRTGAHDHALKLVSRVIDQNPTFAVAVPAHAVRVRAQCHLGLPVTPSSAEVVMAAALESLFEHSELVRLAQVDWLASRGDHERSAQTLRSAVAAIMTKANTIADPIRRNRYLTGPHLVAETLSRARWAAPS